MKFTSWIDVNVIDPNLNFRCLFQSISLTL